MGIESRNPATEELLERFDPMTDAAIDAALDKADATFRQFRQTDVATRAQHLRAAAEILEAEAEQWAEVMTTEMGKTLAAAVAEVKKSAQGCRYYADHAEELLADEPLDSNGTQNFVRHLPLGPVLAVMPWNFPFWQVFRFAAPALIAGNVGLLKHASNVPRSALAIQNILERAGFPEGAFQTLLIGSDKVQRVLEDPRVRAATLTGSEGAGRAVAATAGRALKPTVLELGGSDPFVVMPSANLDRAVEAAVAGRTVNNGQSCIAAKRFIVHTDVYDNFTERFVERFEALTVGDPMSSDTDIGPLAMAQVRDDIDEQVRQSTALGAARLTGAEPVAGRGYFYRPGILADVPESAPAYAEEFFAPIAILFRVSNLDEAIALGNATRFGLGSAIFTEDPKEIEQAANDLDAGATFVNQIVASDPSRPFGGVKASGYGRELYRDGMMAFVNRKTVSISG